MRVTTTHDFIAASKRLFGRRFEYRKTVYRGCKSHVVVTCPRHGDVRVKPLLHLRVAKGNTGCPLCGASARGRRGARLVRGEREHLESLTRSQDPLIKKASDLRLQGLSYKSIAKQLKSHPSAVHLLISKNGREQRRERNKLKMRKTRAAQKAREGELVSKIREMKTAGYELADICRSVKLTEERVTELLNREIEYDGRFFTSIAALARFIDVSASTLRERIARGWPKEHWAERSGLRRRLWSAADDEFLKALVVQENTHAEIAHALGRTRPAVSRRVGILGLADAVTPLQLTTHLTDVERHGRVSFVSGFVSGKVPAMYLCLRHREQHPAMPHSIGRGQGLTCCRTAAQKKQGENKRQQAKASYDRQLARFGKVERIGAYVDDLTPLLHRCLTHGDIRQGWPGNLKKGGGLGCCQIAAIKNATHRKRHEALQRHRKFCESPKSPVVLLGKLEGMFIKTLYRCKTHGEEHEARPNQIHFGGGLHCCWGRGGYDSLKEIIDGTIRAAKRPTRLYLHLLRRYPGYVKPGIETTGCRADEEYGVLFNSIEFTTRIDARLVELALLELTSSTKECPRSLRLTGWAGASEVRRMDPVDMWRAAVFLYQAWETKGRWQFALDYVPHTSEEAAAMRAMATSATPC